MHNLGRDLWPGFHYRWPGFDINFVVVRMDEILVCMRLPGFLMAKSLVGLGLLL